MLGFLHFLLEADESFDYNISNQIIIKLQLRDSKMLILGKCLINDILWWKKEKNSGVNATL